MFSEFSREGHVLQTVLQTEWWRGMSHPPSVSLHCFLFLESCIFVWLFARLFSQNCTCFIASGAWAFSESLVKITYIFQEKQKGFGQILCGTLLDTTGTCSHGLHTFGVASGLTFAFPLLTFHCRIKKNATLQRLTSKSHRAIERLVEKLRLHVYVQKTVEDCYRRPGNETAGPTFADTSK